MNHIQFKNTSIAYTDTGKGTAIVLRHGESECLGYVHSMEDNADAVHAVLVELRIRKAVFVGHSMGGYVALAFAELYPDFVKGLVLLNSTANADSDERKTNRDRAIKAVKQSYIGFVSLAIANLFSENNRDRLRSEIENVKAEALKTPLQAIVASLEGMKIRLDREVLLHLTPYPKLLVLGQKDPVLEYEETKKQIVNTDVALVTFPDGHMSHIENQEELTAVLLQFLKKI